MSADPENGQAPVEDLGDDELDEVAGGGLPGGDGYPRVGGNGGNGGAG